MTDRKARCSRLFETLVAPGFEPLTPFAGSHAPKPCRHEIALSISGVNPSGPGAFPFLNSFIDFLMMLVVTQLNSFSAFSVVVSIIFESAGFSVELPGQCESSRVFKVSNGERSLPWLSLRRLGGLFWIFLTSLASFLGFSNVSMYSSYSNLASFCVSACGV